ncbi:hypothetical protein PM082_010914 [Marasmius tenuissimus]|nr:hypothetical protein PM082_010914 [Marasmius tenuissimus]
MPSTNTNLDESTSSDVACKLTDVVDNYLDTHAHAATSHIVRYHAFILQRTLAARKAFTRKKLRMGSTQNLQKSNLEDEGIFDNEEEEVDDDDDDFENRFQGIDIENAAYEDIWEILTEDERKKFMKAIDNPDSDLRRGFVFSEEHCKPWWEGHLEGEQEAAYPTPMKVPSNMVKATSIPTGPPLIYNLCAICIAYAFATRHLNACPLVNGPERDAKEMMEQLVPFLTEKKSTILHTDLDGVVTDLWSRFEEARPISHFLKF